MHVYTPYLYFVFRMKESTGVRISEFQPCLLVAVVFSDLPSNSNQERSLSTGCLQSPTNRTILVATRVEKHGRFESTTMGNGTWLLNNHDTTIYGAMKVNHRREM